MTFITFVTSYYICAFNNVLKVVDFLFADDTNILGISIQIDNTVIERVKETVFLGVILDEHLSWKPHILSVSRKISKSIGIIYKSSFCLPKTSLRSLYYSLVYPYLTYCVSEWGSTYQSNLNRIIILQKKIIRIISKVSFDAHTGVLFKEQEILKFSDIYLYQIGKFMYLFKRGLLPNYFRDMFTLASQIHSYNTRNSSLFYIPHSRTNLKLRLRKSFRRRMKE